MISASHNPYYDNGIKLIDCYGEKMPEETLLLVEDYIDGKLHVFDKDWSELPFAYCEHIGCTVDYVAGRNRYMGYLISLGVYSFKGVKVGLDCANGSSWNIAKSVFDALGADTYVINNQPNGLNINNNAGSTHIEGQQKFVVEKGLDVGFAYDGDADRCLCVEEQYSYYISELLTLPEKMQKTLEDKERIQWFVAKYVNAHDVLFVGRGIDYAVCLEGSLKLKEISYIHSEAYAAGELKHGTISLIEQGTLVIGVLTQSELYEKTISNMLECKSRGAYLMGLTTYGKYEIEDQVNFTVYVPKVDEHFVGSLAVIPLQLLGYYVICCQGSGCG